MSRYKCRKCQRPFSSQRNLDNHMIKKACKVRNFECKHCGDAFTLASSMYRHIRDYCHVKKNIDSDISTKNLTENTSDDIKVLKDEKIKLELEIHKLKMEKLQREIDELKSGVTKIKNINSNNTTNNGTINVVNNNVINLVGYGQEDMTKFDHKEMLQILRNGYNSTVRMTESVHFNPKYPEYHNIYISNKKDNYAMMFDGKNWMLMKRDELLNMIYDDKKTYIEENLEEFIGSLSVSRRNAIERWLKTDENDKKITEIKERIKLLLYNKRNIPLKTIALIKNQTPESTTAKVATKIKSKSNTIVNLIDDN
jgi:hypothetical protein